MGLKLESVVPWGRSLGEYVRMFALTPDDRRRQILDCGGGPASFNAEMTQQGYSVVSCDPIYQFSAAEIERRIQDTYPLIMNGVSDNQDDYVWRDIQSPEQLCQIRLEAMNQFLQDFPAGLAAGRYQVEELPELTFGDRQFDLALCGHLLFTYSRQLSESFHLNSIRELCRVAQQVRIFPLVDSSGEPSPLLPAVMQKLSQDGYLMQIQTVDYEFQKGGNQLLLVSI